MGEIYGVTCSKCDNSFPVNIGHGMAGCGFFEIDDGAGKPYFYSYIENDQTLADIENILKAWDNVTEDNKPHAWRSEWF